MPDPASRSLFADLPNCGDFDFRIARDGTWFYRNSPIGRPALVRLFASALRRDRDGSYWLVTPVERGRVTVEDAPFLAIDVDRRGTSRDASLVFRTNVGDEVTAGADHPLRIAYPDPAKAEPRPYIRVREGLEALIARPVFYRLVEWAEPGEGGLGLWSSGIFFPLGRGDDA